MRGYNVEKLPTRDLQDVTPLRFNLLVKLMPDTVQPKYGLVLPDSAQVVKNSTRSQIGEVVAMGDRVHDSQTAEGLIEVGRKIIFDESVSIDDPNRCFIFEGDTFILFDLDTVQGVFNDLGALDLLADRYLVERPEKKERTTKAGVFVPLICIAEPVGGKVIEAGKGAFKADGSRLPMSVKVGQEILYPKFGGSDIRIEGAEFVIIKQDKILAILDNGRVAECQLL